MVEPYCHGLTIAGKEVLSAFQVSGFSQSRKPIGWKMFDMRNVIGLSVLNTRFSIRADYRRGSTHIAQIHCCI